MPGEALVQRRRVERAPSVHRASFRFPHRHIVPTHLAAHEGFFATASTPGLPLTLLLAFGLHHRLPLFANVPLPAYHQRFYRPGRIREKPAQPTQTGRRAYVTQQSGPRAPPFALHQPRQDGHDVLLLRPGVQRAEPLRTVAHVFIQTEKRLWHRTPPWSHAWLSL
jgi:hypothetical protein